MILSFFKKQAPEKILNSPFVSFLQSFGPVANMSETVVMQMGCITRGLPKPDLENLPFLLDALEGIGHCGWTESQVMRSLTS